MHASLIVIDSKKIWIVFAFYFFFLQQYGSYKQSVMHNVVFVPLILQWAGMRSEFKDGESRFCPCSYGRTKNTDYLDRFWFLSLSLPLSLRLCLSASVFYLDDYWYCIYWSWKSLSSGSILEQRSYLYSFRLLASHSLANGAPLVWQSWHSHCAAPDPLFFGSLWAVLLAASSRLTSPPVVQLADTPECHEGHVIN